MTINITVETGEYRLISSGTLMTIDNQPIRMTVVIAGDKTICVKLRFHREAHKDGKSMLQDGKSMLRRVSEDGTVDE